MGSKLLGALTGGVVLWLASSFAPVVAGDLGCSTKECYQRVRQPDVYATVERPVLLSPGRVEVERHGPVVYNRSRRVELIPGQFHVQHVPATYGSYTKTVMMSPARTVYSHVPAVRKIVHQKEIVRPASWRWENTVDRHGRVTRCKVEVPAVTRVVAREVVVAPAHTVARVIPAQYKQVSRPMMVSPARRVQTYQPPVHGYVAEPMMIRPATKTVIRHQPVYGMESHQVLVRRGGYVWAPVGRHH